MDYVIAGIIVLAALWLLGLWQSQKEETLATRKVAKAFAELDPLVGKTRQAIIERVGQPSDIMDFGELAFLGWKSDGFHISLQFKNGVCELIALLQSDTPIQSAPVEATPSKEPSELDQFSFDCPACRTKLTVDRAAIGRKVRCPYCERVYPFPPPD